MINRRVTKCRLLRLAAMIGCFVFVASSLPLGVRADEKQTVRVGYYESTNFQEGSSEDERKTGYSYEYLQKIATYTGWEYEYVYGTQTELYTQFLNGEIDLLAGVTYSEDNTKNMNFPNHAMGTESYYLYKESDNNAIGESSIQELNGLRIGSINNNRIVRLYDEWVAENDLDCTLVLYSTYEARKQALSDGEVDIIISTSNNVHLEHGLTPLEKLGESEYYLAVTKDREDILDELNEALDDLSDHDPYFLQNLQNKYFGQTAISTKLSAEEQAWIAEHDELRLGFIIDYLPFCDYRDGQVTGLIKDVGGLIVTSLGLQNKLSVKYVGFDTYTEMIEALLNDEIDAAFPVYKSLWHSEQSGIMESSQVASTIMDMIYVGEYTSATDDRIAVSAHSPIQTTYAELYYPSSEIVVCDGAEDCLKAVQSGRATCTLFTSFRSEYFLSSYKYENLSPFHLINSNAYCIGVKSGNTDLLALINHTISLMDQDSMTGNMYNYATYGTYYTTADFIKDNIVTIAIIIGVILLLIFLMLARHIATMKKNRKLLTAANQNVHMALNEAREANSNLETQLGIVRALSGDFLNIFMVNVPEQGVRILKLDGYVTKGFEEGKDVDYPYYVMMRQYIKDRVYSEDQDAMCSIVK